MSLFYKECEECGTKINKLQNIWNMYLLKTGKEIQCPNCGSRHKTYKIISFIGLIYSGFFIWILPILLLVSFIDSFHMRLGVEVWLFALILYSVLELAVMVVLPLKKVENNLGGGK